MAASNQDNRVVITHPTFTEGNIVSLFPQQISGKFLIPPDYSVANNTIPAPGDVGYQFTDIARLAERLMLDSTSLVAKLDAVNTSSIGVMPNTVPPQAKITRDAGQRMVPLDSVLRGGAAIVGVLSIASLAAYALSGAIIVQPFIALILLVSSAGFGLMSMSKS